MPILLYLSFPSSVSQSLPFQPLAASSVPPLGPSYHASTEKEPLVPSIAGTSYLAITAFKKDLQRFEVMAEVANILVLAKEGELLAFFAACCPLAL